MMHNRVTGSTECLEVVQGIVACAPVAAASRPAPVPMMHGEVVTRAAPLTLEVVSFQRLLSVAAEVEVVKRFTVVSIALFFWRLRNRAAQYFRALFSGACRAVCFWPAVIDVILSTVGTCVTRADNTRSRFPAALRELIGVVSGANDWTARSAYLLNRASRLINSGAFLADTVTHAVSRFSACRQSARLVSFSAGCIFNYRVAAVGACNSSVSSCFHTSYYGGR